MLGVEDVHPDDDFFLLGGHSLVGVRLFAKIKTNFGVNLELATLFEARTVRLLAEVIRKSLRADVAVEKKWPCIVPIQPAGTQIPLFLVHAIGGEVLFYEPLAKALGPDQPLYAIQSALANQEEIAETTIETLAANYVSEIRSFYPHGPYLIGGHSFGGIVAFEMAHQLTAQGAEPGIVVMLDAVVPGSAKHIGRSAQISSLVASLRSDGPRYLFRKAYVKSLVWRKRLMRSVNLAACSFNHLLGRKLARNLRYALMEEMHGRALSRYAFRPYPGTISLIRAVDRGYQGATSISELDDPTLGWEAFAQGGVEVHEANCDHMRMLVEPQVRDVAQEVRSIISELRLSAIAS
jgi:thioesterase domain-containing protein/acyl carrier protein